MKKYRFNLSDTNYIELSEENFNSKETKYVETDNTVIPCKVIRILDNDYYIFAPIEKFEIINC